MLAANVNPLKQWPRVRRVKPGVLRVKGRCITSGQWLVLRVVSVLLASFLIGSVLAAACLPVVVGFREYLGNVGPIRAWVGLLVDFRSGLREFLTSDYPTLGNAIGYSGAAPYDWHLLVVAIVLLALKRFLTYGIAAALGRILAPLLGRCFNISFTRDTIIIHRWLRPLKLSKHLSTGGEITFKSAGPEYQTGLMGLMMRLGMIGPSRESEYVQVMAVAGLRPVRIITPRKQLEAERIVQSLQLALQHSRNMMR